MHEHCAGMFVTQTQMQIRLSVVTPQTPTHTSPQHKRASLQFVRCLFPPPPICFLDNFGRKEWKLEQIPSGDICDVLELEIH